MGAATSVVVALIFLGSLIAGAATYSSFDYYNNLVKNAQYEQDAMNKAKMQTDIAITNVTNKTTSMNLTIKNTGRTTLNASAISVFVSGMFRNYTLQQSGNTWVPENSVNITISVAARTGDRIKIAADNGISDYALVP